MAGFIDNLQIYDDLVQATRVETEAAFIPEFNAGTGGAITLGSESIQGNYRASTFWKKKSGLVTFEDIKDNAAATDTQIEQGEQVVPKVKYRVGPVTWNPDSTRWEGLSAEAPYVALGTHLGTEIPKEKLQIGIHSLVTALNIGGTTKVDNAGTTASATNRLTVPKLIAAKRKLGDSTGQLIAFMHSVPFYDMAENNLSQYQEIFSYEGIFARMGPTGMPIVVMDNSALTFQHTSLTKYSVLLLQPGALEILDVDAMREVLLPIQGLMNLGERYQAQGSIALRMLGWSFSKTVTSPTLLEIQTPGNWSQNAADVKDGPGVLLRVQGSA